MSQAKIDAFKKDFEELCKDYNMQVQLEYSTDYIHDETVKSIKLVGFCKGNKFTIFSKDIK